MRHLNKASGGKAIYRGGGSTGIIGAPRAGYLIAPDPDDVGGLRRLMAPVKMNIAVRPEKKEATDLLRECLADGPRRSKEVEEEAREAWGISVRTLKRARQKLGVRAIKDGKEWWMEMPEDAREEGKKTRGSLSEAGTVAPRLS